MEAREHHRAGRFGEAERRYRAIIDTNSPHAPTLHAFGILLFSTGRPAEGLDALRAAVHCAPEEPTYLINLGGILTQTGAVNEAIAICRRATEQAPDDPRGFFNLGVAERAADKPAEARASFEAVIRLAPEDAEAHINLGGLLLELNETEPAETVLARAVVLAPDNADAQNNFGGVLQRRGKTREAVQAYERALALRPDDARTRGNLASALTQLGQLDAAEQAYRAALAERPTDTRLWRHLAQLRQHEKGDPDLVAMEALWARSDLDAESRVHLAFALGKALEDTGQYPEAIARFTEGNRLHRATFEYEPALETDRLEQIAKTFTTRLPSLPPPEQGEQIPIFIVGMPRSGTTLVEAILGRHSNVSVGGELTFLPDVLRECGERIGASYPALVPHLTPNHLAWIAAQYRDRANSLKLDASYFTDKLPFNFLRIGLIRALFPDARIVHCKRSPLDTCLSCYTNYFSSPQPFAYHVDDIAQYYLSYEALMAHWREHYPQEFVEIEYEGLVSNPDGEIPRLLEGCGLRFEQACLSPHESTAPVRTASLVQVRQPISTASMEKWRRYGSGLDPLVRALGRHNS